MRHFLAIAFVLSAVFATACACWKESEKRSSACTIVDHVIDCSKEAVQSMAPHIKPLIEFLLSGANGDPNWQQYLVSLEATGLDVVACTAQQVNEDLVMKAAQIPDGEDLPTDEAKLSVSPESVRAKAKLKMRASKVTSNFEKWKASRLPLGTIIKTKK